MRGVLTIASCLLLGLLLEGSRAQAPALYPVGSISAQEQYYIELINRTRVDPAREGRRMRALRSEPIFANPYREFGVDLKMFVEEMALLPPAPPVVPNQMLRSAALRHSRDIAGRDNSIFTNAHGGSDGSTVGNRVTDTGFAWGRVGENVYRASRGTLFGHVAFVVDWGDIGRGSSGGMQTGRGHRMAIVNPNYTEVGVADLSASWSGEGPRIGPRVVTQVFAAPRSPQAYVTGVAYLDLDADKFYTPGEGIGGVRVDVVGSGFRARTGKAGGFAVPVPGDGEYRVIFSARGVPKARRRVIIENGRNVKLDFRRAYLPRVSGAARPAVGEVSNYTIAAVPGATAYRLKASRLRSARAENAEGGTRRLAISSTGSYDVVQGSVVAEGDAAFHLAHPTTADQIVRLRPVFVPTGRGEIVFRSRLRTATKDQVARVDVFHRGEWRAVWTRAGAGSGGQAAFEEVRVPLAGYAGEEIKIRFVYAMTGGSYFPQETTSVGWFFDDIRLPGVREVAGTRTLESNQALQVNFQPVQAGWHLLRAEARVSGRYLPPGPAVMVRAVWP
jgi:hypothetical protein